MVTANKRGRAAPYVPASTLSQFFDHIRYVREPETVDSGLLQDYGISQGHVFALLSTLKFLSLVDESGKPTPVFRDVQTGGDEFRDALRGVVERAYADLFSRLDVSRDTKDKIVNFFARNYSPATAEKAARLFLDLCGEAGIETASQPRSRGTKKVSNEKDKAASTGRSRTRVATPPTTAKADDSSEQSFGPRIDIRINSQDLVNMQADQITALFDGLKKLTPTASPRQDVNQDPTDE